MSMESTEEFLKGFPGEISKTIPGRISTGIFKKITAGISDWNPWKTFLWKVQKISEGKFQEDFLKQNYLIFFPNFLISDGMLVL